MRGRARGVGPLVAVVGLLVLSGCTVTGEAVVGPDSVTVDLHVEHAAPFSSGEGYIRSGPCDNRGLLGLEPTQLVAPRGRRACILAGTLPFSADGAGPATLTSFFVTRTPGTLILRIPPGWPGDPRSEDLEAIDVRLRLPGEVITSNANDLGAFNEVRWTDADVVNRDGIAAVARTNSGVPPWMLPTTVGLLVGSGAFWLGSRALRRLAAARRRPPDDADLSASAPGSAGESGSAVEDPSVWADEE